MMNPNKNEERIWDTLIEDALRDGGSAQPPGEYTRRLLTPAGAPGVDRGRSLRRHRRKWAPVAVTALALVLVAFALYAATTWLPQLTQPEPADQLKAAETQNQSPLRKRRRDESPSPTPTPEPQDSGPTDSGEPTPDDNEQPPEPKPDDTIKQPKPEPKPDDTIEQPKPEPKPDDAVKEPKKPDDTVETPKQPEGTSADGEKLQISVLKGEWAAGPMRYRYSLDGETWRDDAVQTEFGAEIWLDARSALTLKAEGVLVRLEGKIHLKLSATGLEAELARCDVYFDNRGCNRPVTVSRDDISATMASGDALLSTTSSRIDVSVFDGELVACDGAMTAGQHGSLIKTGFKLDRKPQTPREQEALLSLMPPRTIYRETFDADPRGRLREGAIKDGVLSGATVFWGYPENLQHSTGLVLRLRIRFTNTTGATVTQFAIPRNDNFSLELDAAQIKAGEWQWLELPIDKFLERTTHKEHPSEVDLFQNISIQLRGDSAQVELDWIELIRAVK